MVRPSSWHRTSTGFDLSKGRLAIQPTATPDNNAEASSVLLPVIVVALLSVLAVWRAFVAGPPAGDDWGQYLSHARALLEGRSYSDIGYLFSPPAWIVGPSTYPPGLPLTLVPILAITEQPNLWLQFVMHGFLAGFLACAWHYFGRTGDRTLAWGMVALLGTGFLLRGTASYAGSDLGMCAFIWAVVALADVEEPWSLRRTVLIGALGLLAILYRIAAVPIAAAAIFWACVRWYRFRKLDAAWGPLAVGVLWAVGFWTVFVSFAAGTEVIDSVGVAIGAGDTGVVSESLRYELARLDGKILRYRFALSETFLYAFPGSFANRAYHVVGMGLTLVGLWVWLRHGWSRFSVAMFVATGGFLLAAPVWDARYAWVLTPFFAYGLVQGFAVLAARVTSPERAKRWATAVVVSVSLMAIATSAFRAEAPTLPGEAEWREVGRVLLEEAPQPVRVASNRPRSFTWLTRIPAAGIAPELESFLGEVERLDLTHVVLSRRSSEEDLLARVDSWRISQPGMLDLVATVGALEAYRINRESP